MAYKVQGREDVPDGYPRRPGNVGYGRNGNQGIGLSRFSVSRLRSRGAPDQWKDSAERRFRSRGADAGRTVRGGSRSDQPCPSGSYPGAALPCGSPLLHPQKRSADGDRHPRVIDTLRQYIFYGVVWLDCSSLSGAGKPVLSFERIRPREGMQVGHLRVTAIPVHHSVEKARPMSLNPDGGPQQGRRFSSEIPDPPRRSGPSQGGERRSGDLH